MKVNRTILILVILSLFFSSCSNSSITKNNQVVNQTPILSTPSAEPTVKPTIIPLEATVTQGISIKYQVYVKENEFISIDMVLSNFTGGKIVLYRLASPDLKAIPKITEISVKDPSGKTLDYSLTEWQGEADRHLQILDIETNEINKATISYTLDLRSQQYWISKSDYIMASENMIFFQPDCDSLSLKDMRFVFTLPSEWKVVTRLTPANNEFILNLKDSVCVVTKNHEWQCFYLGAPLVLGKFDSIENMVGDMRVIAAYPIGNEKYKNDAEFVNKLFNYQVQTLGNPSKGIGDFGILYVFGPPIPNKRDGGLIPVIGLHHGDFEVYHVTDNRHQAHEMYHMFIGDGNFYPNGFRFILIPAWFSEGINEYLGVKSSLETGAFTKAMTNKWQIDFYRNYRSIEGTKNDAPLTKCLDLLSFRTSAWTTCLYSKSHTMFLILDRLMNRLTNNTVGIEQVIKYLLDTYANNPLYYSYKNTRHLDIKEILQATNQLTGYDFKPFFDAFISGNEILPIIITNNQLEVDWGKIPELIKK
jgi:hypothetical protein